MFAISLTAEWDAWVADLAAPLQRRLAWRLPTVVAGILVNPAACLQLVAGRRGRSPLAVLLRLPGQRGPLGCI